jgi:hypothetical protein
VNADALSGYAQSKAAVILLCEGMYEYTWCKIEVRRGAEGLLQATIWSGTEMARCRSDDTPTTTICTYPTWRRQRRLQRSNASDVSAEAEHGGAGDWMLSTELVLTRGDVARGPIKARANSVRDSSTMRGAWAIESCRVTANEVQNQQALHLWLAWWEV